MQPKQGPSSQLPPAGAQDMPSIPSFDFEDAVVGGGDLRIVELVNEARKAGFPIEDRSSTRRAPEQAKTAPHRFENVGE